MIPFNSDFLTELVKQLGAIAKELSQETKYVILSVFVLMNYWFISIFLIANDFYKSNFGISIDICFILSITWFIGNLLLISLVAMKIEQFQKLTGEPIDLFTQKTLIAMAGVNSIIYLSIILFGSFYLRLPYGVFLLVCLCYIPAAFLIVWLLVYKLTKKHLALINNHQ